jgi:hypothetical protein
VQGCSATKTNQVPEGFPQTNAQAVYDEYDFQRATQAYTVQRINIGQNAVKI